MFPCQLHLSGCLLAHRHARIYHVRRLSRIEWALSLTDQNDHGGNDDEEEATDQDAVYLKYVRFGAVNISVNAYEWRFLPIKTIKVSGNLQP